MASMNKFPTYPRISKSRFRSWNEEMFIRYNNERVYYNKNPIIRFVERKRVEAIIKFLQPLSSSDQILAAGCGEGYIENKIPIGKITLVDLSKEAIRRAKSNSNRQKDKKFIVADLEHLPFAKSSFDKIECSEVIEHVYSPKSLLSELHRVLKPNGSLVITFPNEPFINLIKKFFIFLRVFHFFFPNVPKNMVEEWHLRSYDLSSFRKDSGHLWKIENIQGVPFNFSPIRYVVLCKKL